MTKTETVVVETVIAQCDAWMVQATAVLTSRGSAKVKGDALAWRDEVADVARALRGLDK